MKNTNLCRPFLGHCINWCLVAAALIALTRVSVAQQQASCPIIPASDVRVPFTVSYNNGYRCSPNGNSFIKIVVDGVPQDGWCADSVESIRVTHDTPCDNVPLECGQPTITWPADFRQYNGWVFDSLRLNCLNPDPTGAPPLVPPALYEPGPVILNDPCVWNKINYLINHKQGNADSV